MINESHIKDPDYKLEVFWFSYKCCFENFYKIYPSFENDTEYWSYQLNDLKKKKKYNLIQKKIFDYLLLHTCDVIKSKDLYHSQLLKTNIHRYIKLCNNIKFYSFEKELCKIDNIIRIYCSILNNKYRDNLSIFNNIEDIIFNNIYDDLIDYAIKNKKGHILDKIRNITDINPIINRLFNINIKGNICGKKIINLYYTENLKVHPSQNNLNKI